MNRFEIYPDKSKNGQKIRWRFISRGKIMAISEEPFSSRSNCARSINRILRPTKFFMKFFLDKKKQYRWRYLSANGRVLGISACGFKTKATAEKNLRRFMTLTTKAVKVERI